MKDARVKAMPMIVHCLNTQTYYYLPSVEQLKRTLNIPQGGYLTTSYVDTGKSYKKKYIFYSLFKFNSMFEGKNIEYDTSKLQQLVLKNT